MSLYDVSSAKGPIIIYDGECIFCKSYVRLVRLQNAIGKVTLKNARCTDPIVEEIIKKGYDLNKGMVFILNSKIYYDYEAINMIALLGSPFNIFNKINIFIFKNRFLARTLYPLLKLGRLLYLKLTGRVTLPTLYRPNQK